MISACDEAGVGLFVAYYRRAMPRFATVKELLDSGRIGDLRSLTGRGESPSNGHSAVRTARVIDDLLSDYRNRHGINYSPAKPGRGVR
jgi:predicted dehydrogenase